MELITRYINDLQSTMDRLSPELIEQVINILHEARINHRQVFIMGNGGSASTASHFVCDLAKNTRREGWPNFKILGLNDNMALFSAYANDEGYETVFAQQLANFIRPGDIVIGISTSGNSPNVVNAIRLAKNVKAITIGFTGFDGGQLGSLVDINLQVNNDRVEQVEDTHLMLEHLICKALQEKADQLSERDKASTYLPDGNQNNTIVSKEDSLFYMKSSNNRRNQVLLELLLNFGQDREAALATDKGSLQQVLHLIMQGIGAISGSIFIIDDRGDLADGVLAHSGEFRDPDESHFTEILQRGLAGWVVSNRQPVLVLNTRNDPRWLKRIWDDLNGSRSAISVPIMRPERVIGVLTLAQPKSGQFTVDDLVLLSAIAICVSYKKNTNMKVTSEE